MGANCSKGNNNEQADLDQITKEKLNTLKAKKQYYLGMTEK